MGLDLTARDLQSELKAKGLPWEKAKAFDGSARIGDLWADVDAADGPSGISDFDLERNGTRVQQGKQRTDVPGIEACRVRLERYITLEPGDLLFTGTPAGVGPIASGDALKGTAG